jgi:phosphoserine phosphatase
MTLSITLVSPDPQGLADAVRLLGEALSLSTPQPLGPGAVDFTSEGDLTSVRLAADQALAGLTVDHCVQPMAGRRKRLLIADMDSTIIGCECLDELADFAGVKAAVSEITERAMRGELEFEGALRERVAMLAGLDLSALKACYEQRVRLNPGARTLVTTMAAHGARCLLVSGGFTYFTSRVAVAAGFHEDRANRMIEADGALTGAVADPILGREAKLAALTEESDRLGLDLSESVAIGDGANDLAMIEAAGLGIAYRAKPLVAARAAARIDHADLTALLYFQGYRIEDFAAN